MLISGNCKPNWKKLRRTATSVRCNICATYWGCVWISWALHQTKRRVNFTKSLQTMWSRQWSHRTLTSGSVIVFTSGYSVVVLIARNQSSHFTWSQQQTGHVLICGCLWDLFNKFCSPHSVWHILVSSQCIFGASDKHMTHIISHCFRADVGRVKGDFISYNISSSSTSFPVVSLVVLLFAGWNCQIIADRRTSENKSLTSTKWANQDFNHDSILRACQNLVRQILNTMLNPDLFQSRFPSRFHQDPNQDSNHNSNHDPNRDPNQDFNYD